MEAGWPHRRREWWSRNPEGFAGPEAAMNHLGTRKGGRERGKVPLGPSRYSFISLEKANIMLISVHPPFRQNHGHLSDFHMFKFVPVLSEKVLERRGRLWCHACIRFQKMPTGGMIQGHTLHVAPTCVSALVWFSD